jgi:hypothetical protein
MAVLCKVYKENIHDEKSFLEKNLDVLPKFILTNLKPDTVKQM